MNRPMIKAGYIENLTDARYFAAWNVEWIGFHLDENDEDAITIQELQAIKEWIEGPKVIAEIGFINLESNRILQNLTGIDGIQISGFAKVPQHIRNRNYKIIREIVVQSDGKLPVDLESFPTDEILLIDFDKNSVSPQSLHLSMETYIEWITKIIRTCPAYILDLPFSGEALNEIIEELQPQAIHLKGSEEEKVGFKSYDDINDFFELYEE